jgi:Fe2+ or Zn2+ uptake regulation protein
MESSGPLRMTRQRRVIMEEMDRHRTHPSAEEVWELVRARLPRISLGTVYRNLELMAGRGLVDRVEPGTDKRRYGLHTGDHAHIRCVQCGRVDDAPRAPRLAAKAGLAAPPGYQLLGYRIELQGLCPQCAKGRRGAGRKLKSNTKLERRTGGKR